MGYSIAIMTQPPFEHPIDALKEAVRIAGGQTALGKAIGKSQAHVSNWIAKRKLPAEMVLPVERATGVSRHDLRPDIYPRE
jgi:DNA-binding transcriptional regulator YdaS (Cro superfamily)